MAVPAAEVNITIEQGADFDKTWTYYSGATSSTTPVDLTGATAKMQIRRVLGDPSAVLSISTTPNANDSKIVLGDAAGTIRVFIDYVDTAAMVGDDGVYDLEITYSGGVRERFIKGTVTISKEVTKT